MIRKHYNENKSKKWNRLKYEKLYPNIPEGVIKDYIEHISDLNDAESNIKFYTNLWAHSQEELIKLEDFIQKAGVQINGNRTKH